MFACPLRLPPVSLCRRRSRTLVTYRKAVRAFLSWIKLWKLAMCTFIELDELIVEYSCMTSLSKSHMAHTVAAVEMAIPRAKGQLVWSRQLLKDMEVATLTNHHIPMPAALALLIAVKLSYRQQGRLGAGIILSVQRGLRPSELLGIHSSDIILPSGISGSPNSIVINLGDKAGTKANRQQAIVIKADAHALSYLLCHVLCATTPPGQLIMNGITLNTYQRILERTCVDLKLPQFSPHSCRAGFATECVLAGKDFVTTREEGRWASDQSLRIYLDTVAVSLVFVSTHIQQIKPLLDFLHVNFTSVFNWWVPVSWPHRLAPPERWRSLIS
jgi:integrase